MSQVCQRVIQARAELAVWEVGVGEPVVLVHGFPDHPLGLLPFAERIAAHGFRCLCPALPGYHPSAPVPDGDYGAGAVGADLIALLDALELEAVRYVGHDWGAELAFPLAADHPDRFVHLVSLAVPHPSGYAIRHSTFREQRSAWYAVFLAYVKNAPEVARRDEWLTALVQDWSPGFHWIEWPEVLDVLKRPGVLEAVCAYYRANLEAPAARPIVPVPTTILHGAQDGCISPACHPDFSEYFPLGVKQVTLSHVGHWPHLEDPAATAAAVLAAFSRSGG